ncbi:MAG: calcium/sodium antiporter [Lachnospiraceae bacterium]|nr:calcium/sodium antiporter [Lachnospiraceae bacterium]
MVSFLKISFDWISNPTLLKIVTNPYLLFAIGLVLLIKGGDWFVDGASGIAQKFHVPEILIGATVVSIGTTLPEVMVSAGAAFRGNSGIAYGNALGSIICNTALIAALTIAIRPSKAERKPLVLPVVFFFLAAAVYVAVAYVTKDFSRGVGILLLVIFVVYMTLTVRQAVRGSGAKKAAAEASAEDGVGKSEESEEKSEEKPRALWFLLVLLVVGAALIAVGADLLVDNAEIIASRFGVPDSVIALTIVALGTSLPELVTAITSLIKGHSSLSLGNIIGANLFNIVLVSGTAITIRPFGLPCDKSIAGINASLLVDIPVALFVMLVLTIPTLRRERLSRVQGVVLLATYAAFITFQVISAVCL